MLSHYAFAVDVINRGCTYAHSYASGSFLALKLTRDNTLGCSTLTLSCTHQCLFFFQKSSHTHACRGVAVVLTVVALPGSGGHLLVAWLAGHYNPSVVVIQTWLLCIRNFCVPETHTQQSCQAISKDCQNHVQCLWDTEGLNSYAFKLGAVSPCPIPSGPALARF